MEALLVEERLFKHLPHFPKNTNSMIFPTPNPCPAFTGQGPFLPPGQRYEIQPNSQHKLFIYSPPLSDIMKNMNQDYEGWQYFALENDPKVDYLPLEAYPRKPSSDDILCDLVAETTGAMTEDTPFRNIEINRENTPASHSAPRKEKKKRQVNKTVKSGQERGHWKIEENKRYHWFLELHSNHFLHKHLRRMDKIFKSMERFIATREAEQCRSHHQKMEKKHGNFVNILRQLRSKNYGDGGIEAIVEEIRASGVECGELMPLDPIEEKMEVLETDKSSLSEPSQEEEVDLLHELNRQYEPNIEFLMF